MPISHCCDYPKHLNDQRQSHPSGGTRNKEEAALAKVFANDEYLTYSGYSGLGANCVYLRACVCLGVDYRVRDNQMDLQCAPCSHAPSPPPPHHRNPQKKTEDFQSAFSNNWYFFPEQYKSWHESVLQASTNLHVTQSKVWETLHIISIYLYLYKLRLGGVNGDSKIRVRYVLTWF